LLFNELFFVFQWRCSACYTYHRFSLSVSEFLSNPDIPSPHTVQIVDWLLCISSVEVSKCQLTKFAFFYRWLSTPNDVSTYPNDKTYYNPSVIQKFFGWNMFVFLSCIYTVHLTRSLNRYTNTCTLLSFLLKLISVHVLVYRLSDVCVCCRQQWFSFKVTPWWRITVLIS